MKHRGNEKNRALSAALQRFPASHRAPKACRFNRVILYIIYIRIYIYKEIIFILYMSDVYIYRYIYLFSVSLYFPQVFPCRCRAPSPASGSVSAFSKRSRFWRLFSASPRAAGRYSRPPPPASPGVILLRLGRTVEGPGKGGVCGGVGVICGARSPPHGCCGSAPATGTSVPRGCGDPARPAARAGGGSEGGGGRQG